MGVEQVFTSASPYEITLRNPETATILSEFSQKKKEAETQFAEIFGLTPNEVKTASHRYLLPDNLEEWSESVEISQIVERAKDDAQQLISFPPATLTKYDRGILDAGAEIRTMPVEKIEEALITRALYLRTLNGPERMKAVGYFLENVPFKSPDPAPVPALVNFIDNNYQMPAFDDLGLLVPDTDKFRVSRSSLFGVGVWVRGSKNRVVMPYAGSSMPDCSDSPWAVVSMAMAGGFAFIPRDARLADIKNQAQLTKDVFEMLDNPPFPFIDGVDEKFVKKWWKNNVVGIVEADPYKALKRMEALYNVGVRTFRIYSPEGGVEPEYTLRVGKSEFSGENVDFLTGMITSAKDAEILAELGTDAVVGFIGGGGICSTPTEAGLAFASVKILHDCKRLGLEVPIIVESGVGRMTPLVIALGGSVVAKSQALFGGTLEQPGAAHYYVRDGELVKPYGGEASNRTRNLAGRKEDVAGKLLFREGDESDTALNLPTMAQNLWLLNQSLATALVFARQPTVGHLHQNPPEIFILTENNQKRAGIHHNTR